MYTYHLSPILPTYTYHNPLYYSPILLTTAMLQETDLNNDEKQFLLAVERGDIPTARHFMEESQIYFNININCVDPLGRTALLIAIENENIEMIELLLIYNVELGDALLHAISEENVEAVEMLLAHQQTNKKDLSVSILLLITLHTLLTARPTASLLWRIYTDILYTTTPGGYYSSQYTSSL